MRSVYSRAPHSWTLRNRVSTIRKRHKTPLNAVSYCLDTNARHKSRAFFALWIPQKIGVYMQEKTKSSTKVNIIANKNVDNISDTKNSKIIKSKDRVRKRAEVFTRPREVNNILALTQATSNPYWRFLEPACGNGNFLEAILRQRLERLKQDRIEWHIKNREFSILKVLSTIYGVDIAEDNMTNAKNDFKA